MRTALITLLILSHSFLFGQGFTIKIGSGAGKEFNISNIPDTAKFDSEIKSLQIKKNTPDIPAKQFKLDCEDEQQAFATDGNFHQLTFIKDIRGIGINVLDENGNDIGSPFALPKTGSSSLATNGTPPKTGIASTAPAIIMPIEKTATQYIISNLFKNQIRDIETIGLKVFDKPANGSTRYYGSKYIHLFFDQNGNSLLRSIPIGIGRANYVVHVVYLTPEDNPTNVEYKVNQTTADIEEGVVIRGDGGLQNQFHLQAGDLAAKQIKLVWRHSETALTASSVDVKFDIVRSGFQVTDGNVVVTDPVIVATREIKMKRVYHGSIDIGLLKTNLENPTYTLTASDVDPNQSVVKKTNTGSRVFASAMYTFYLSPIVLIEKLLNPSKVQNYKIEGRSFVDDHKIYERIYPTVGVALSEKILDNIFLGGKWEFIRGGSIFVGYHWGKVNVLNVDDSFEFGKSYMTQSTFDLKTDTQWKGALCFGFNLDVRIITNLFQAAPATGQ